MRIGDTGQTNHAAPAGELNFAIWPVMNYPARIRQNWNSHARILLLVGRAGVRMSGRREMATTWQPEI